MGLGWLFTQIDWGVILFFSFAVALVTVMPEFYALLKAPARWIPINSPPFMIGDDYHYFSLLNNVHRRLLNWLYGTHLTVLPLSANSKFQLCGYLLNLIPYHIGYLVADRRISVLFVRIWNRFFLGLSVAIFSILLYKLIGIIPTTDVLLLTYLAFFLLFPGPFGLSIFASIAKQLRNSRYIYDRANANDLTRAMFSETTGPLLIIACALLLAPFNEESATAIAFVELLFVVILFFHYLPAALVFSWLAFLTLLSNQLFLFAIICAALTLGLAFFYFYVVSRDEVGKEIFAHSDGGKLFAVSRYQLVNVVLIFLCVVAVVLLVPEMRKVVTGILYVGSGFFVLTNFFAKHQGSRFWDRAAVIPFQLMSTIACFAFVLPLLGDYVRGLLIVVFLIVLFYYHYRQAKFLFEAQATLLSVGIEFERDICPQKITNSATQSRIVATNSIECAYTIAMFSGDESLLRNYSIQPLGYKKHLVTICANFKVLGYEYSEFERLFTLPVLNNDWLFERPFEAHSKIAEKCFVHTLQYMATNREYNYGLIIDGMYSSDEYTDSYKKLLRAIWDSTDVSQFNKVDKIVLEKPF